MDMLRFTARGLADDAMERYQGYYCGLCQALGRRYGRTGQLALSYDMAFVCILLTALYDEPHRLSAGAVPPPLRKRPRADNPFTEYAADMTAALAYYNLMDDWQDDHRRAVWRRRKGWSRICPLSPALASPDEQNHCAMLDQLNMLEGSGSHDLDALCNTFGAPAGRGFCLPG